MIRIKDASILALTKLRARKIRTIITVMVSGLLFAGLIAALIAAQGADQSIKKFNATGLGDRYIVLANSDAYTSDLREIRHKQSSINLAKQIYEKTVEDKKQAAEKLGIPYTPSPIQKPVQDFDGPEGKGEPSLSYGSPITTKVIEKYWNKHADAYPNIQDLKKIAKPYNPIGYYSNNNIQPKNGELSVMWQGKETFLPPDADPSLESPFIFGKTVFSMFDPSLAKPFLLKNRGQPSRPNAIPLIVPYEEALQLLGEKPLNKNAPANQQLQRLEQLYDKAANYTFAVCYRNKVSKQQVEMAILAKAMPEEERTKQSIIYGLPDPDSCGPATVIEDNRTESQKVLDEKQKQFKRMFGEVVEPRQQKIYFRIVGLAPNRPPQEPANNVAALLQNLAGSSLNGAIGIPKNLYQQIPKSYRYQNILQDFYSTLMGRAPIRFIEFASAKDAREFIKHESCTGGTFGYCATDSHPFMLTAYGSNSLALKDIQNKFIDIFKIAVLVVTAFAAVILSGTVGRMIADSRRETALFRAIGAKRLDIVTIYAVYTLMLSTLITLFSLTVGILAAFIFDQHFSLVTTVQAQLAYGAAGTSTEFHFFKVTSAVLLIVASILIAGLLSMILPLLRNIRRNPINDLRDE